MSEGCGDDGKAKCHASDLEIVLNNQKMTILQKEADERSCRKGNYAHCSGVAGVQIQVSITAGIPTEINPNGVNLSPAIFYGYSLVFDKYGGFQIFTLKRDIKFDPYFNPGPAERANPWTFMGAGATLAAGVIRGTEFEKLGTEAYTGRAVDTAGGLSIVSADSYAYFDEATGTTDPTRLSGDDIGISAGTFASGGTFAMYADPWFDRIGLAIANP